MRRLTLLLALLFVFGACLIPYDTEYHSCRMALWMRCRVEADRRHDALPKTKACVAACGIDWSNDATLTQAEGYCLSQCHADPAGEAACWRYAGHECRVGESSRRGR